MKFRNVTKLQLAFADYEALLEDIDRMQFGTPHANHESAERSDVLASRQYALKAMDVIDKRKEKKNKPLKACFLVSTSMLLATN